MTSFIREIVRESIRKPSDEFGKMVLEVDHQFIGQKMRTLRMSKNVQSSEIAKRMGFASVSSITFLENGNRYWNKELMRRYIVAVRQLSREAA